ncbi:amidase [Ornithinimicrobium sufpigmenti]|uniref:amidase n=1 Tax=Ornithinimicrobium sufpigmenti TaxID=2508882 RepID=UPI00103675E6|nr:MULTISPECIES: amidase [unclassified Ornithinimicrobium]
MSQPFSSPFVPHDLPAPLAGSSTGPLSGFTVAVKDMFDVAGTRTGGGSPAWLEAHPPAEEHSGVVRRLLDAGASIVGKTVCDEFFYSTVGKNAHYGTPLNPRTPDRVPGGSSSGSASATASGACDLAIGSDTGGSVRVPAANCGLYGIRVTQDRFDFDGAMSMAPSFDAGGWFSASAGLLRHAGPVLLQGPGVRAQVGTVALLDDALATADPAVARIVERSLVAAAGRVPEPVRVDLGARLDDWREAMRVVQAYEVWQTFGPFITSAAPSLGPGVRERMEVSAQVSAEEAADAKQVLASARRTMDELTPVGTVLALPTTPSIAPRLDAEGKDLENYRVRGMRLVCMASISGLPQVTIPVGVLDSAPVSLSFIGWRGGDEALLDLAVAMSPLAGTVIE